MKELTDPRARAAAEVTKFLNSELFVEWTRGHASNAVLEEGLTALVADAVAQALAEAELSLNMTHINEAVAQAVKERDVKLARLSSDALALLNRAEAAEHLREQLDDVMDTQDRLVSLINVKDVEIARLRSALAQLREAASRMPRKTPTNGGASTMHTFQISAADVWALDIELRGVSK